MWMHNKYKAWIDLSTYCNAACPQCHRTSTNGLGKVDWLDLIQWDLDTFKQAFPASSMTRIEDFQICGTWGDPCMNKDIMEICKYIIDNSKSDICISTNGSMRDEEWWWDLAVYCRDRLSVVFTVDGIDQQMHERYRRKTDLSKILDHMEVVSQAGAYAKAFTVVFKHNEDYIGQIGKLVKSRGAHKHIHYASDRFKNGKPFYFYNEQGKEEILEESVVDSL